MTASPVEWILVIYYGVTAHKATYGRFSDPSYSKDYIQLYRTDKFLLDLPFTFPDSDEKKKSVPVTFRWPNGSAPGTLFRRSADRPHLTWETKNKGAPPPWRMALDVNEDAAETIPGNPVRGNADGADEEFSKLGDNGAGQPYLMAVKLQGEPDTLHLRAYLDNPGPDLSWAGSHYLPPEVRALLAKASPKTNLAWMRLGIDADMEPLFFDPDKNHDAWHQTDTTGFGAPVPTDLTNVPSTSLDADGAAEALPTSEADTEAFRAQIEEGDFEVDDAMSPVKTRGSAQRAFSEKVKKNYGWRCAVSGISTKGLLVGAHIVPWSQDKTIRLDPANGICLSVFFDKVFELGLILIDDDLTIAVSWEKIGSDTTLGEALKTYDGKKLKAPSAHPPRVDFLERRRKLFTPAPS